MTAIIVLGVFSLVVIIHEWGHYIVCRLLGVRVEKFAIGFGRELFGFDWKNTRWSFCILPLGGYVKPAGEDIEDNSGKPDEFFGQPWYGRIAIALAGPIMNYILAFLCFFWLMFYWGEPRASSDPVIGEVVAEFPAQAAGLQKGDRILAINGKQINQWEDAAKEIHDNPEKPIDIKFQRVSEIGQIEKIIALVPKKDAQRGVGLIGISPTVDLIPQSFARAAQSAVHQTVFWTTVTLKYLGDAVIQRKKPELAGPIGIVSIVAKVSKEGMQEMISLIAMISLSLGLFNFFPVPLLDGGHVMLYLMEGVFRKPLNKTAIRAASYVGAALLLLVFVFATIQDITRLRADFLK